MSAEPFAWTIPLCEIGERGLSGVRQANAGERAELARALDIAACDGLSVTYELHPLRSGMYRLRGRIEADVTQTCVITLEPIAAHLSEPIDVELRPGDMMPAGAEGDQPILEVPDIEPLDGDIVDIGLIVLEHIATSLDPYPRKSGVNLEYSLPPAAVESAKPFAKLAKLKDRS